MTTGAYAAGLLPWESKEAFKAHCEHFTKCYRPFGYIERGIVNDMAVNRWQRKRLHLMTTIATYRHEFGQAVMQSGAESWQGLEAFVRESSTSNKETFDSIATSMLRIVEISGELVQKAFDADEASEVFNQLKTTCINGCDLLKAIDAKLDLERDFFEHYIPEKFEQRIKLENLLDGQFDKLHARLQILQEARLRRDALEQAAAVNELAGKPVDPDVESDSPPDDGGTELGAPDCDETLSADGAGDEERDPLTEFVEEQSNQSK